MAKADPHNWNLGRIDKCAKRLHSLRAMCWITGTIRDEKSVKVMGNFVYGVVVWETSDAASAADKTPEDVFLHAAVDKGNVHIAGTGADVERGFGGHLANEVDTFWIDVGFVLLFVIFLPHLILVNISRLNEWKGIHRNLSK